jgi:hypothetical protein
MLADDTQTATCATAWGFRPLRSSCSRPSALTAPGRSAMSSARRSPVGVKMLETWKWRNPSFPKGCWRSFPSRLLEMQEAHGNGHFQTSRVISIKIRAVHIADGVARGSSLKALTAPRQLPPPGRFFERYPLVAPTASSTICPYWVSVRALLRAALCSSGDMTRGTAWTSDTLGTCG